MIFSFHNLKIKIGRYNGIDRLNNFCKLCNQYEVEAEYPFLLCCSKYTDILNNIKGTKHGIYTAELQLADKSLRRKSLHKLNDRIPLSVTDVLDVTKVTALLIVYI